MVRILLLSLAVSCVPAPPPAGEAEVPVSIATTRRPDAEVWPQRTDAEVDAALEATCAEAVSAGKPVLIVFSAPWCPDCRRMNELEQQGPLLAELQNWQRITIDPGRFDRHVPLLQAFGVAKIATWVAARPTDCRLPAPGWPRLQQGVFEPKSGRAWTAEEITDWLKSARGA